MSAPGRRLGDAAVGEVVWFAWRPIVRGTGGAWVEAPSDVGEVVYTVGGSPFVRFLVERPGLEPGRTRPVWVASSTPLLSGEEARAREASRQGAPPSMPSSGHGRS